MAEHSGASAPLSFAAAGGGNALAPKARPAAARAIWQAGRYAMALDRPLLMGIVNLTPDSFSDGGRYLRPTSALQHAEALLRDGAQILDFGAESTRPGAPRPSVEEELARLLPVLREVRHWDVPVSVDCSRAEVISAALGEGADIINDVRALREPAALQSAAAQPNCGLCLMHMQGEPGTMQRAPTYANNDVLLEVKAFLADRLKACADAGIAAERIVLDPGIGFGKTPEHNWVLLARQAELLSLGRPLLLGWSRKSSLGLATGRSVAAERDVASAAAALLAVQAGASIIRTHNVAATRDAMAVLAQLQAARQSAHQQQPGAAAAGGESTP
jgi:dihydropteroate synthase